HHDVRGLDDPGVWQGAWWGRRTWRRPRRWLGAGSLAGHAHSMLTALLHLGGSTLVTRPAPPLQHGFVMHHHHHGPVFVFVEQPFFTPFLFFGYASPYSPLYDWGPPSAYPEPPTATAPFFCSIDGIGFTNEERFAHHLHEVHGMPLDQVLSASELV